MKRIEVKKVAIEMVQANGLINLSRSALCARAELPDGSFPHVMGCTFKEFVEELEAMNIEEATHVVSKSRVSPALRREQILKAAVELSKTEGYSKITRDKIAKSARVSVGLVTRYFSTMPQLRRCVMRYAVQNGVAEIVAQGLANGDAHAKKASPELKEEALSLLAKA